MQLRTVCVAPPEMCLVSLASLKQFFCFLSCFRFIIAVVTLLACRSKRSERLVKVREPDLVQAIARDRADDAMLMVVHKLRRGLVRDQAHASAGKDNADLRIFAELMYREKVTPQTFKDGHVVFAAVGFSSSGHCLAAYPSDRKIRWEASLHIGQVFD